MDYGAGDFIDEFVAYVHMILRTETWILVYMHNSLEGGVYM